MKQIKKAEQQLIVALNRLQEINFTDVMDKVAVGAMSGSTSGVNPGTDRERYFSFNLANYSFAVNASHFCEVFVAPAIAPLPNAPDILMGLFNVRGILVPVYQLHGMLHQDVPAHRTVFCIGKGEHTVGILTDNLPSSVNLPGIKNVKTRQAKPGEETFSKERFSEESFSEKRFSEEKQNDSLPDLIRAMIVAETLENNKNYLLLDGSQVAEQLLMLSLKQPFRAPTSKSGSAPVFY